MPALLLKGPTMRKTFLLGILAVVVAGSGTRGQEPASQPTTQAAITPVESEEQAIAAIKRLGGKVEFDEKASGKPVVEVNLVGTNGSSLVFLHDFLTVF